MFTFNNINIDTTRGPWYWMIRFQDGAYNKQGIKAFTLKEACDILKRDITDVKRVNFQTGRDKPPMSEETKEKLRAITVRRRELRNSGRKKKKNKKT